MDLALVLNNPLDRAQNVRVTLYNRRGEALAVPEISMAPNQNLYFNIADWLTASGGDNFAEGSLQIFFHGRMMGIGGQLVVTDENHSLSFDVPFVESGMFASSRLESLWWALDSRSTAKNFPLEHENREDGYHPDALRQRAGLRVSAYRFRVSSIEGAGHKAGAQQAQRAQ